MAAVLLLGACSTSEPAPTTAANIAAAEFVSTTAAPTTTAPSTTTTTVQPSTTTTVSVLAIEAPESSPVARLDSFSWEFETTIGAVDTDLISLETTGVYVDGDFDCAITTGFGGFDFSTRVVVSEGATYFDDGKGDGLRPVRPGSSEIQENARLCPGSPVFWADITNGETLPAGGDEEERNGIVARRLNLTGLLDEASALGLVGASVDGVTFDELVFWVAEGDWISAISMRAGLEPAALQDITGSTITEPGEIRVTLDVTRPDDGSLAVTPP